MEDGPTTDRFVGVYNDDGESSWCVDCTCNMLTRRSYTPVRLTAEDILSGELSRNFVGIVFPGGRDSPYHDKLQGPGNRLVRHFVERGGWYLGLCAGDILIQCYRSFGWDVGSYRTCKHQLTPLH